jgi:ATP-binding cassette subfamily C protein
MSGDAGRALLADFRHFAAGRLTRLSLLMVAGAVAEGLGIVMLVPLLALASGSSGVPEILQSALGVIPAMTERQRFAAALIVFLLLMALRSLLIYARGAAMVRLEADYTADMRLRSAAALAGDGWGKASQVGLAGMQSLLLTEIPRATYAAHEAQMAAVALAMLFVQFVLAALLSPPMAAIGAAMIAIGLAASWGLLGKARRRGVAISAHGEESSGAVFRLHSGLKAALAQGTSAQFLREYGRGLSLLRQEYAGFGRDRAATRAVAAMAAAAAAAALMFVGHQWLQLPFAVLATLLVLFARMSGPAQSLQQSLQAFAAYAPSFGTIERDIGPLKPASTGLPASEDSPAWSRLHLQQAGYRHPASGFTLSGADLTLGAGEWVGITGPSGGGKTTLVDLMVGLLPPDAGMLTLDGDPLAGDRLAQWRNGVSYVGQNEMTFEATVRQNLLAGSARDQADEALWQALATAGIGDRIRAFDQGLETHLGDRGSSLSGGERQRLGIARALLRAPRLIILDEATSALDQEAELALLGRLRTIPSKPAVLLVAHRAAPLELCDRVIRVEAGQIQ